LYNNNNDKHVCHDNHNEHVCQNNNTLATYGAQDYYVVFVFDGFAGFTLQDTRTSMDTEHVEQLMFIEQNQSFMPAVQDILHRYNLKYNKGKAAAV
jgi:hypothetical protein